MKPAPMAWMVDRLAEKHLGYSLIGLQQQGAECMQFGSERELAERDRPGPMLIRGIKRGKETGLFTRETRKCVGFISEGLGVRWSGGCNCSRLFRDADQTHACNADTWEQKRQSMERGFALG